MKMLIAVALGGAALGAVAGGLGHGDGRTGVDLGLRRERSPRKSLKGIEEGSGARFLSANAGGAFVEQGVDARDRSAQGSDPTGVGRGLGRRAETQVEELLLEVAQVETELRVGLAAGFFDVHGERGSDVFGGVRSVLDAVGDRIDARITNIDKRDRKLNLSVKAHEMAEEKQAMQEYGSSDSGASLGDILGAALTRAREEGDETAPAEKTSAEEPAAGDGEQEKP